MQNTAQTQIGGTGNPVPETERNPEQFALSIMGDLIPKPGRVSADGKTRWLRTAPVAVEACGYSLAIWDKEKEVLITIISVLGYGGQVRGVAEIARGLETIVNTFNKAYELGRQRGCIQIIIKSYAVLIQHEDQEPHCVLLGVVADGIHNYVTDIDENFYFYMTQSEFYSHETLIGVELDDGTYIRDYDPSEQPEVLIGNVIE